MLRHSQRQPLRDSVITPNARMVNPAEDNSGRKPRRSRSVSTKKKKKKNLSSSGRENEPKKSTPTKSKSENAKVANNKSSRVKVLLGGMFGKRPSATSSSNRPPLQLESPAAQQPKQLFPASEKNSFGDCGVQDGSQTTVLTETETATPSLADWGSGSFVVDVHTVAPHPEVVVETLEEKQHKAAVLLQAVFRGYQQRYEFRMLVLRDKLQRIEANKERQLKKLEQRTKTRKRQAKSVFDFQDPNQRASRVLQRVARIVPYLFREAQTKLEENAELASTPQHVKEMVESNQNLQNLAHSYLESLEDIPGIWEALEAQWMGPKQPRPRRSFGPDGKIVRQPRVLIELNTHDDDLPVNPSPRLYSPTMARAACDDENEHSNLFVNLFIQAAASEIYSSEEDQEKAVSEFHKVVGKFATN